MSLESGQTWLSPVEVSLLLRYYPIVLMIEKVLHMQVQAELENVPRAYSWIDNFLVSSPSILIV